MIRMISTMSLFGSSSKEPLIRRKATNNTRKLETGLWPNSIIFRSEVDFLPKYPQEGKTWIYKIIFPNESVNFCKKFQLNNSRL